MNKNQKLFADKSMEFAEELYKRADSELLKLLKQQKINRDTVMGKVAEIMLKYEIKDTKLNLSNSEFKKLYSEFKLIIVEVLKSEAEKEVDTLKELLTTVGTDKFYSNSFLLSLGMNFELQKVSDKVMKEVVNKKIQGMNFVDRTWENKTNKVAKILQNEVKEFLQGKTNLNRIEQVIKHRFNSDASITKRLVRNEVARVQTEINEVWAKDHNVDWQMWMATLDDKTSEICQRYDGKTWKRTDPRKKIPIEDSHINCRCCLVSLPSEDYRPDKRIDNKTKEDIDWKDYNEWKNSSIFDEIAVSKDDYSDIISSKKWLNAEFPSRKKFDKHIKKHLQQYGDITNDEYLNKARELLAEPLSYDIEGFVSKLGFVFKYRISTNDFAIGRADGKISTLYKPDDGYNEWLEQIKLFKKE